MFKQVIIPSAVKTRNTQTTHTHTWHIPTYTKNVTHNTNNVNSSAVECWWVYKQVPYLFWFVGRQQQKKQNKSGAALKQLISSRKKNELAKSFLFSVRSESWMLVKVEWENVKRNESHSNEREAKHKTKFHWRI